MPSNIFRTIVKRKIDTFIGSFIQDANSIFRSDLKLIHPGEYGTFREDALKELLGIFSQTPHIQNAMWNWIK